MARPTTASLAGSRMLAMWLAGAVLPALAASEQRPNGFSLEGARIPAEEIRRGGPPRDGIPALVGPAAVPAGEARWRDDELVIGVAKGGSARAYPIAILVWHELVNDELGGVPILVSYCPLCGTGIVFDRRIGERTHQFGVSGLLYKSDVLMYDRETGSLWSQIAAEAVTGASSGRRLALVRSRMETWGVWKVRHPDTTVLSRDTGYRRSYGQSPYGDYARSPRLLFPVERDSRYHPKMRTVGLRLRDGSARAYPLEELERASGVVVEEFAGRPVRIALDPDTEAFSVDAPAPIEVIEGYWFAWAAFHPDTTVFVSDAEP